MEIDLESKDRDFLRADGDWICKIVAIGYWLMADGSDVDARMVFLNRINYNEEQLGFYFCVYK